MVKNIRLTEDPAEIDCRVNKTAMVLRTEFVKKA
jgi:protein PhnA